MKVYIKRAESCFDYPDEMAKILTYLTENGSLNVSENTVERLYREFSEGRAAGWLCVDDEVLEDFANWLADLDL